MVEAEELAIGLRTHAHVARFRKDGLQIAVVGNVVE